MNLTRPELEECYSELEGPLFNFALRWTWDRTVAEEMVQEAFVRVWQKRDRIDRATLKPLLYKIVQNLALTERRREFVKRKFPVVGWLLGGASRDTEKEYSDKQTWLALQEAVEALPEELRKTLLLCEFSDLSYDDIAVILEIPAGTVASRKNRAIRLLKDWRKEREGNADAE